LEVAISSLNTGTASFSDQELPFSWERGRLVRSERGARMN